MQLHVQFLLLFIIIADVASALLHHQCGGTLHLDQTPSGHLHLNLPGVLGDTNTLNPINLQTDPSLPVCTWMINIPLGLTVLLKLIWLESGSNFTVCCVGDQEELILETGGTILLRNNASLNWTGTNHSLNPIQLSYHVQEDERNSSLGHSSLGSDGDVLAWSRTGSSFTSGDPAVTLQGEELGRGTEGGISHLHQGYGWTSGPQATSGPTYQDRGLPQPPSSLPGLTQAVTADRETLPLPPEQANNGADTSGVPHLTDGPVSAREGALLYFPPQHHTETHIMQTETETQTAHNLKYADVRSFNTLRGTDTQKPTPRTNSNGSGFGGRFHRVALSGLPSMTTSESSTIIIPREEISVGESGAKGTHSWRSHQSTERSPTEPQWDNLSSASSGIRSTATLTPQGASRTGWSHTTDATEVNATVVTSVSPNFTQTGSVDSDVRSQMAALGSSISNMISPDTASAAIQNQTRSPENISNSTSPYTSSSLTQWEEHTRTPRHVLNAIIASNTISPLSDFTENGDQTTIFQRSPVTPVDQNSAFTKTQELEHLQTMVTKPDSNTLRPTHAPDTSQAYKPFLTSSKGPSTLLSLDASDWHSSPSSYILPQMHTVFPSTSSPDEPTSHTSDSKTTPPPQQTSTVKSLHPLQTSLLPTDVRTPQGAFHSYTASTHPSVTTAKTKTDRGVKKEGEMKAEGHYRGSPSSPSTLTPTAEPPDEPPSWTTSSHRHSVPTLPVSTSTSPWSSIPQMPKFYVVPDQSVTIRVDSIELLLQIIVEESKSASPAGLEEDAATWMEPYLQRAPGFNRLLGVWSSGHAVQSLVEFKTSGVLQWLHLPGPASLLERTGLAQAVRERRTFRSSRIMNITIGGLQSSVCEWLLQCATGYECTSHPGTANYSCSSSCHFDYCHHHGICTHHPDDVPVCHCLVGEDFWYMGHRCDIRMTRARLVGACLAILLVLVAVIAILAFVAVRRYRAILIQAKVDQTRSSYRRFNHFDELSSRFWLRSWAGSADSLNKPTAFTRSDELLHMRALDRPCCYHDDTLSLVSTCPSHGAYINTIYPHSSQYGWRGSVASAGDGVLDSGKASDLSVCSWPVEPIQWTPFPLLQQLSSHRTTAARASRPRSYCEGMELVDLGKSWTA
ncbi:uncharacterized protein si:ch211-14k19.8 isoform X2 [Thalassophryne amazonica]|uniref:uncharacterized protein si:ch211-14k19.8 isoform X2 n=1 Tax=Thalassophryne amazonica TaxID=390379 RepID=UPI0014712073|nr:uncharacterized protein si:ch211-14k19.8 isoform X2 [Thalassophryne amazonica]